MNNLCLKAKVSVHKQRLFVQKSKSLLLGPENQSFLKFVSSNLGFKTEVCDGRISEIGILEE
jgi:hypothetical protein